MKPIQPKTLAIVGPLLLGVVVSVVVFFNESNFLSALFFVVAVTATGCLMFWPWAISQAVFQRDIEWTLRNSLRIQVYLALFMGLSLGYLTACWSHRCFDLWMLIPIAVGMVCAGVKGSLVNVVKEQKKASQNIDS